MTLVLKSNQAVIDTENKFPIVTDMGEATVRIAQFKKDIELEGGVLNQSEFDSLNKMDRAITALDVWNNIVEFMPIIGSNLGAKLTKLKYKNSKKAVALNDFDASNVNSKALVWGIAQGGGARCLNLGITINEIYNQSSGMGTFAYFKYNNTTNPNVSSFILGAGSAVDVNDNAITLQITTGNGQLYEKFLISAISSEDDYRTGTNLAISKTVWDGGKKINQRKLFVNGTKKTESFSKVQNALGTASAQNIHVGAMNGNGNSAFNFLGQIGLIGITDGSIPEIKLIELNTILSNFISESGKALI